MVTTIGINVYVNESTLDYIFYYSMTIIIYKKKNTCF